MVNPGVRRETDLSRVRSRLLAMVEDLNQRRGGLAPTEGTDAEEVLDDVDRAQRISEIRFTMALESAVGEARVQIARALEVLECGAYGRCEDCGSQIGKARLAFRPESTRCLPCQSRADRHAGGTQLAW
jgi:DnaK suppressor protein